MNRHIHTQWKDERVIVVYMVLHTVQNILEELLTSARLSPFAALDFFG